MPTAKKVIEAADVVDDVKDLVEDSVELLEVKIPWLKTTNAKLFLIGASGIALGAIASYAISVKSLKAKYQQIADDQVEDVKQHYAILHKEGDNGNLNALASRYGTTETREEILEDREEAQQVVNREGYRSYDKIPAQAEAPTSAITELVRSESEVESEAEVVEQNVFDSDLPDTYWNWEEELQRRETNPNEPFVITKEEFDNNETDADQNALTYYDGDDVLADERDVPIDEKDTIVGVLNLLRFGHASEDPKVVYVRNAKLGIDFEITQSEGKFAKEVLGFDDELRHSDRRPLRKFRSSDE